MLSIWSCCCCRNKIKIKIKPSVGAVCDWSCNRTPWEEHLLPFYPQPLTLLEILNLAGNDLSWIIIFLQCNEPITKSSTQIIIQWYDRFYCHEFTLLLFVQVNQTLDRYNAIWTVFVDRWHAMEDWCRGPVNLQAFPSKVLPPWLLLSLGESTKAEKTISRVERPDFFGLRLVHI